MEYGIDSNAWYSPNDVVRQGLLFGKSKRYVFDLIKAKKLKAINTSDSDKPQWKIKGQDLIDFIKEKENSQHESQNTTDPVV